MGCGSKSVDKFSKSGELFLSATSDSRLWKKMGAQ